MPRHIHRSGPKMSQFPRNLDHARRFLEGETLRKLAYEADIRTVTVRTNVYRLLEKAAPTLYDSCATQQTKDQAHGFNYNFAEYLRQDEVAKEFQEALTRLEDLYNKGEVE